jgi:hypothetical protein
MDMAFLEDISDSDGLYYMSEKCFPDPLSGRKQIGPYRKADVALCSIAVK